MFERSVSRGQPGFEVASVATAILRDVSPQPFEVEIVGREFWEAFVPLVGPFAIAVGALVGVWFSNRAAGNRHKEQLDHDRDLHEKRRALDRELNARQLESDRAIRAMEETRSTIDEVTNVLTNAMDALTKFVGERSNLERIEIEQAASDTLEEREEHQRHWNAALASFTESLVPTYQAVEALRPAQLRLRLRFPDEHPVFTSFVLVCAAVENALTLVAEDGTEIRSEEVLAEEEEARVEVSRQLVGYVEAVRKWSEEAPLTPDQKMAFTKP